MNLQDMKGAIILLGLIALIGSAVSIAIAGLQTDLNDNAATCSGPNGSFEFNITCEGQQGILNATSYLGTIGTIIGVAVLIGIVVLAFTFVRR